MTLTFICSLVSPHFLSLKLTLRKEQHCIGYLVVMDQNLKDDNFIKSGGNVNVPMRTTNNDGEKSNKCNQCEYASSVRSSLKSHLEMHSGEKSNKCNQCSYALDRVPA